MRKNKNLHALCKDTLSAVHRFSELALHYATVADDRIAVQKLQAINFTTIELELGAIMHRHEQRQSYVKNYLMANGAPAPAEAESEEETFIFQVMQECFKRLEEIKNDRTID